MHDGMAFEFAAIRNTKGSTGCGERQLAYRVLFGSELDSSELGEIRDTVNRGSPLGSGRFKDEIERALACAVRPPKRGRPTRSIMLYAGSLSPPGGAGTSNALAIPDTRT